jgi:hypothetical protein
MDDLRVGDNPPGGSGMLPMRFVMTDSLMARLIETLGAEAALEKVSRSDSLDIEAERLLRDRLDQLQPYPLLRWLALEDPLAEEAPRPTDAIVARVVGRLGDGWQLLATPNVISDIRDPNVRDELIEKLRAPCGEYWFRFALMSSGGAVFTKVRDHELELQDVRGAVPPELLEQKTSLTARLFDVRRDDAACRRELLAAVMAPTTRLYALWLLREVGVLASIGSLGEVLGDVASYQEVELHEWPWVRLPLEIAEAWPDDAQRRTWYVKRSLAVAARGVSWGTLWWEIAPPLRDEVALASLSTEPPAPWALAAVRRGEVAPDTWRTVLRLLEREPDLEAQRHLVQHATWSRTFPPYERSAAEVEAALREFQPGGWDALAAVYRPTDDSDDEEFVRRAYRLGAHRLADVLLRLPRTKARAERILRLALDGGFLWTLEDLDALTKLIGETDLRMPLPPDASWMPVYRRLVGHQADAVLRAAIDASVDSANQGDPLALSAAIDRASLDPSLVTGAQREALRRLVDAARLSTMASLQAQAPWLLTESDVVASAMILDKDLGRLDGLPAYLRPILEAKAATTADPRRAEQILDRCESLGASRRDVLTIALERLRASPTAIGTEWLSRKLTSGALWEDPGTEILAELLRERTSDHLQAVFALFHAAFSSPDAPSPAVLHTVLARVLIRVARADLEQADAADATRALTALAHLSPKPRVRDSVRALRKLTKDEHALRLIQLNEDLLRRGEDDATLGAVADALGALEGAKAAGLST